MSRAGQLRYWPSVPGFVEKPKPLLPLFLFITAYTTTIFLVIFLTYDLNIYPFLELTQKNISRLGAFLFPNVGRFSFDQVHHFGSVELAKVQSIISVFHLLGLGLVIFLLLDALVTSKNMKKFFEQFSPSIRKGIANQSSAFLLGAFGLWFLLIGGFDLASDNKLAAQLCLNESCYVQDDLSLILAAAFQAATLTLSLTLLLSLLAKIFLNIVEVVLS